MVIAFIFLLHIILTIVVFVKKQQSDALSVAFIDLILIIIIFTVGWSISTMFCKIFWEPIGFGKHFDRDTIALIILTIGEFLFYRIYYKNITDKELHKNE